jgi:hypothetical protein
MHSYQPSRGRILFEVLCALGIAAALADAWLQTDVRGLAAAALVAALYGLVHFFDLFRRNPAVEVEPQRIDFETPVEAETVPVVQSFDPKPLPVEPQLVAEVVEDQPSAEDADAPQPAIKPAKASGRVKAPRKGSNRRASKSTDVEATDLAPAVAVEGEAPAHLGETLSDMAPEPLEAPLHSPVTPLFEPETFGRPAHRATFGRKVG